MNVIRLSDSDASISDLVGGKAANLGELLRAGERVPDGFCVTTAAHRAGEIPAENIDRAYRELGEESVAVRSSATAEDLPEASFAGQQDTFLYVRGQAEVIDAVRACWGSLHTERAVAYRRAHDIAQDSALMAVVIQRMVDPVAAGVLFTANPMTGCRAEMVVDATRGAGTGVVDGSTVPDHYVLGRSTTPPEHGCLDTTQLAELRRAGERVQRHFGTPQDVEWAIDRGGVLWLLQSRPITTLFPAPPDSVDAPRVYVEFGHLQGMLRPFTPMGMSLLRLTTAMWFESYGGRADSSDGILVDIGGRFYLDLTDIVRSTWTRARLPDSMRVYGPRVVSALETVLADPRFTPRPGLPVRPRAALAITLRTLPPAVTGIMRALACPAAARQRAFDRTRWMKRRTTAPLGELDSEQRLQFAAEAQRSLVSPEIGGLIWPVTTGVLVSRIAGLLLGPVADEAELSTVLGGLPHNVTTEMDLALWRLAREAKQHRELLLSTSADELSRRYREETLPDIGLGTFLAVYGHRAAAEIDVGVTRWSEDPAPLFAAIANYLRITDPEQAPDRRFSRAATAAETKISELVRRARRVRPIRGRLAAFFLRRTRELAGLRELAKFAWVHGLAATREQLLFVGADLTAHGVLDRAEDIFFLELHEACAAVRGVDQRALVATRKALYTRETRRTRVPTAMLSDGTDLDAVAPSGPEEDALTGLGAAPGVVTARARVIRDPLGAHVEPGEILVAPTTDPGWTPLFLTASGLVTETGAQIAHGPTVAREYGIPAVICVPGVTQRIATGQLITVDGVAGTVLPRAEN